MSKSLVITEKPSVARDIVAALGGFEEHDGYWESDDYLVTFSVGHLVELLAPEDVALRQTSRARHSLLLTHRKMTRRTSGDSTLGAGIR